MIVRVTKAQKTVMRGSNVLCSVALMLRLSPWLIAVISRAASKRIIRAPMKAIPIATSANPMAAAEAEELDEVSVIIDIHYR